MKPTTLLTAEQVPFNLDGRKMHTSEKVELVHLSIKPGEEVALHSNPFDVIFYILEGEGTILYENESIEVEADNCLFVEKNKQRGLKNKGKKNFRIIVIKLF